MKIAIFGSSRTSSEVGDGIKDPRAIEDFCLKLGSVLGDFPHALLVESDSPRTADRVVVDGLLAARAAREPRIWVYHRTQRSPDPPFAEEASRSGDVFLSIPLPEARLSPSHLRILRDADLAIVIGGGSNAYAAGLAASLMNVRLIPVATFGGAGRLLWQQLSDQFRSPIVKLPLRHTWDRLAGDPRAVIEVIRREITALPRLMIVHGRSNDRMLVEDILHAHGIVDPIVLRERFEPGLTIPEKFEREALQADGALALFTPDDEAAILLGPAGEPTGTSDPLRRARARQNVILECGWFWGRLGRERVLLLTKGEIELPTDLAGMLYESYITSPEECHAAIADFVEQMRSE
jgi:Predicted nucleotide-binding protein containing TIR-like domain